VEEVVAMTPEARTGGPERWETNVAAPFLTIETSDGPVTVQALGEDRFRVSAPGHEQDVVGLEAARSTAHKIVENCARREG
jgi:hypothetical protein